MKFTNIIFLFFVLPVFFSTYYFVPEKFKNFVVLLISLFCLFWTYNIYVINIFIFSLINYMFGYFIYKTKRKNLKISLFIFILLIIFEKIWESYNNFFIYSRFNSIFRYFILFFLSINNLLYLLDIYTEKIRFRSNFVDYFLYIFMFPKFLFGPVFSYHRMEDFFLKKKISSDSIVEGIKFFIFGFFEVSVICYEILQVIKFIFFKNVSEISLFCSWLGVFSAFSYVYFYLIGYNYMAVGLLKMMGFFDNFRFKRKILSDKVIKFFNIFFVDSFDRYFKIYMPKKFFHNKKFLNSFVFNSTYFFVCFFIFSCLTNLLIGFYIALGCFLNRIVFKRPFFIKIPDLMKKIFNYIYILFLTFSFFINKFTDSYFLTLKSYYNFVRKYFFSLFGINGIFVDKSFIFFIVMFRFVGVVFLYLIIRYFFKRFEKNYNVSRKFYLVFKFCFYIILFIISILYCFVL